MSRTARNYGLNMLAPMLKSHFFWQARLLQLFMRRASVFTAASTLALVVARFAQVFSLFIPLKIIIILGADRMPGYLQGVISAETRNLWIAGLTMATLVLYLLSISLVLVSNRLIVRGVGRLALAYANGDDVRDVRKEIRNIYATACRGYADWAVFALGVVGLALLNPLILLAMLAFMAIQLALTSRIVAQRNGLLGRLANAIGRSPAEYLKYLAALNFLGLFVLMLLDLLLLGNMTTTTAILTLLLGRRMFQSLGQFAKKGVRLQALRNDADAIFFTGTQDACSASLADRPPSEKV